MLLEWGVGWGYWDQTPPLEGPGPLLDLLFPSEWTGQAGEFVLDVAGAVPSCLANLLTLAVTAGPRHLSRSRLAAARAIPAMPLPLLADYVCHPGVDPNELEVLLARHLWTRPQARTLLDLVLHRHPARAVGFLTCTRLHPSTRRALLRRLRRDHRPALKRWAASPNLRREVWLQDALLDLTPVAQLVSPWTPSDGDAVARRLLSVRTDDPGLILWADQTHPLAASLRRRLAHLVADLPESTGRRLAAASLADASAADLIGLVPADQSLDSTLPTVTRSRAFAEFLHTPPVHVSPVRVQEVLTDRDLDCGRSRPPRRGRRGRGDTPGSRALGRWAAALTDRELLEATVAADQSTVYNAHGPAATVAGPMVVELHRRAGASSDPELLLTLADRFPAAWVSEPALATTAATCRLDRLHGHGAALLRIATLAHLLTHDAIEVAEAFRAIPARQPATIADLLTAAGAAVDELVPPHVFAR